MLKNKTKKKQKESRSAQRGGSGDEAKSSSESWGLNTFVWTLDNTYHHELNWIELKWKHLFSRTKETKYTQHRVKKLNGPVQKKLTGGVVEEENWK